MCPRKVTAVNGVAYCITRRKAERRDAWAERRTLSRVLKGNVQTLSQLQRECSHALHERGMHDDHGSKGASILQCYLNYLLYDWMLHDSVSTADCDYVRLIIFHLQPLHVS